jgi:metal-responsive CopG/Arc/MetJ family transcriptional regulator
MFYNMIMRTAKRIAQTVCITLPPDLLKKAQKVAAREHRTMSELFREALRHYLAEGARDGALPSHSTKQSEIEVAQREQRESGVVHSFRMEKPTEK